MMRKCSILLFSVSLLPWLCAAQQAAQTGSLCVKTSTGRAGVFVDGKYVGPAANFGIARTYEVAPGTHEVKLVEPRYEDTTASVTVKAGKKTTLRQAMKELPPPKGPFGRLRTESADKFAAVYVNDHFMGHAGEFNNSMQGLMLPAGDYAVRIVPATGAPVMQNVKLEADKTVIVR